MLPLVSLVVVMASPGAPAEKPASSTPAATQASATASTSAPAGQAPRPATAAPAPPAAASASARSPATPPAAAAGRPVARPHPDSADKKDPADGPLDFRCDKMQVLTKPNRTVCVGNVVFRRGPALVCCEKFEGFASDKWELEKGTCTQDVRAQRGDELVWADRADYDAGAGELVLTGRPLLRRGQSLLEGERVVARLREEQAHIDKPRGRVVQEPAGAARVPVSMPQGPLPARCPLPSSPRR